MHPSFLTPTTGTVGICFKEGGVIPDKYLVAQLTQNGYDSIYQNTSVRYTSVELPCTSAPIYNHSPSQYRRKGHYKKNHPHGGDVALTAIMNRTTRRAAERAVGEQIVYASAQNTRRARTGKLI